MAFQDCYWTLYTRALCYWMVYDHVLVLEYGATFPFILYLYTVYNVYDISCYYVQFLFNFYVCPHFVFIANESSLRLAIIVLVVLLLHDLMNQGNKESTLISMC